jgi:hypothetical protein
MHNFFHFLDIIPVGTGEIVSCGFGGAGSLWRDPDKPTRGVILDGISSDDLGIGTARALGRRLVEVTRLMKIGKNALESTGGAY